MHVSHTAAEGLELASRTAPDLILLDILMPVMNGYEAARRLREIPSFSGTVLIACSGSVDEPKARAAGFDGWLVKPICEGDLDAVLAMVVQRINSSAANASDTARDRPQ